nr:MAG TPA: hypothetical protein [Caudoviricetes sp.]
MKISAFSRISGDSFAISAEIFSACFFCSSDIALTSLQSPFDLSIRQIYISHCKREMKLLFSKNLYVVFVNTP